MITREQATQPEVEAHKNGSRDHPVSGATVIQTEKLTKYYGKTLGIIDLDLSVLEGEVFGFLGPNGAGKTTTIRLLMDHIRPTSGSARIFGLDTRRDSVQIKKVVGYLPGELSLWNNLTGRQILTYLGNLRGGVSPARINDLAERLQLDLGKKFRELSRGNKQKVGLIQAIMHKPRLLILDEPTSGLDPLNQQEFFRMLRDAANDGATVFLSSHVLSEVEHTSDRVGMIRDGRLVRVGAVNEVVAERFFNVSLTFAGQIPDGAAAAFSRLPGVGTVSEDGNTITFSAQGDLDPVVKQAALYSVSSFVSHEPTLEEAFLQYYRPDSQ